MTIDELRQFRGMQKEVEQIQREISLLYYPISSPKMSDAHGTSPGDPTASAVAKIMRLEERLCRLREELADQLEEIEQWLESLDDHELRAIIRAHYLLGDSWARCTQRVMSYEFSDSAKHRVYRYFGLK